MSARDKTGQSMTHVQPPLTLNKIVPAIWFNHVIGASEASPSTSRFCPHTSSTGTARHEILVLPVMIVTNDSAHVHAVMDRHDIRFCDSWSLPIQLCWRTRRQQLCWACPTQCSEHSMHCTSIYSHVVIGCVKLSTYVRTYVVARSLVQALCHKSTLSLNLAPWIQKTSTSSGMHAWVYLILGLCSVNDILTKAHRMYVHTS